MTARLLVLIPRIKYYFQCVEKASRFSFKLGHFLKQSTNCVFVLEEYPSVLLAYFEMQTT